MIATAITKRIYPSVPGQRSKKLLSSAASGQKSRRVRTGCLTCRERHLKCDEAVPSCMNCRKSDRHCKRGIRLNFLEVNVHEPRRMLSTRDWIVEFHDESRQIASEYRGGLRKYSAISTQDRIPKGNGAIAYSHSLSGTASHRSTDRFSDSSPHPSLFYHGASRQQSRRQHRNAAMPEAIYSLNCANHRDIKQEPIESSFFVGDDSLRPNAQSDNRLAGIFDLATPTTEDLVAVKAETVSRTRASSEKSSAGSVLPQATNPPLSLNGETQRDPIDVPSQNSVDGGSQNGEREYLASQEEVHFMQVFVDKVAVWMDSFDSLEHFSQITPYRALKSPMLLNACLACGVKHQSSSSPEANLDDKALSYYNTATTQLLRSLQNPDRDMTECATAAVVLNVYETIADTQTQRMYHVAGARALIRECGWDARSTGIGAACFWLNIEMEVMNCLAMNWRATWDPEGWGVDMDMMSEGDDEDVGSIGREEHWVYKIFYIMAKVANFKASAPGYPEWSAQHESVKQGERLTEWETLKNLCTRWNNGCPRTMHPMGYLDPEDDASSVSCFPKVWMIKRAAVISRLFYHTARCILAQTAPEESPRSASGWHETQVHHARQVCGIIAHTEDLGISSVALRCIAIVGPALHERPEQEETLKILRKFSNLSGLQTQSIEQNLKQEWISRGAWCDTATIDQTDQRLDCDVKVEEPCDGRRMEIGTEMMANPLSSADFNLPNHPYQNWYEPPSRTSAFSPLF